MEIVVTGETRFVMAQLVTMLNSDRLRQSAVCCGDTTTLWRGDRRDCGCGAIIAAERRQAGRWPEAARRARLNPPPSFAAAPPRIAGQDAGLKETDLWRKEPAVMKLPKQLDDHFASGGCDVG